MPQAAHLMEAFRRVEINRANRVSWQRAFRLFGTPASVVDGASFLSALRKSGQKIQMRVLNRRDVIFCGVPREYEALVQNWPERGLPLTRSIQRATP